MKKIIYTLVAVLTIAAGSYFVAEQAGSTSVSAYACSGTSQCE